MMGVFNIMCGGSYFGNVFVNELVEFGFLDIVFLDYVFVVFL